ncbi:MAG: hypothetical protein HY821_01290 [Acidobacteria bacterium]|nr:hypothetical protein [Acidobacteriota bacterium]
MPVFRIYRMKETVRQQFRWAPHTCGVSSLKPKDYEAAGEVTALGFYDAWMNLRGSSEALEVGDILESESGELRICKYVGFEEARWVMPEIRTGLETAPLAAGPAPSELPACPA